MRRGVTIIEVLFTVAIIATVAAIVIWIVNPAELIKQGRDANRVSDLGTISKAVSLYYSDAINNPSTLFMGTSSVIYVSIPDPSATSTAGDQCQGLSLPSLPTGYSYQCAATSTYTKTNGTGWIPINFVSYLSGTGGSLISKIPVDPTNQSSSRLYYTYTTNGTDYEVTSAMESAKYKLGGSSDVIKNDGSNLATVYTKGTNLTLEPLDYGDSNLAGYWPLNEGSGTTAIDYSGNGNNAKWYGTPAGTGGTYYTAGKLNTYAAIFNATTSYIQGSSSASLMPSSTVSIAAWVETPSEPTNYAIIVGKTLGGPNWGGYYMEWAEPNNSAALKDLFSGAVNGDNYTRAGAAGLGADGNWHYLVTTVNAPGANVTVYLDGVLLTSWSGASDHAIANTSTAPFVINPNYENSNSNYVEEISNVRIYSRVLSPAEIVALYNGGK